MNNRLNIIVEPCNHCRERTGIIFPEYNVFHVKCMNCHYQTHRYGSQEIAFKKWNEGDIHEPQPEEI